MIRSAGSSTHFRGAAIVVSSVIAAWVAGFSATAGAEDEPELKDNRFTMGIGLGLMTFDTNVKFEDKQSGLTAFVDAESNLGLPENKTIPVVFGRYRFSNKHALGFSLSRVRRVNTFLAEDFNLGDYTITGEATLSDQTRFYSLNYTYTFLQDDRSRVFGAVGLYGLDMNYRLELFGQIERSGEIDVIEEYEAEAGVFAPLPMFGLDAVFALTPKWSLATKVTLVGGKFGDISGTVFDTTVRAHYTISRHLGLLLGVKYFDADVKIDEADLRTDVSYAFDGILLGLSLGY